MGGQLVIACSQVHRVHTLLLASIVRLCANNNLVHVEAFDTDTKGNHMCGEEPSLVKGGRLSGWGYIISRFTTN